MRIFGTTGEPVTMMVSANPTELSEEEDIFIRTMTQFSSQGVGYFPSLLNLPSRLDSFRLMPPAVAGRFLP